MAWRKPKKPRARLRQPKISRLSFFFFRRSRSRPTPAAMSTAATSPPLAEIRFSTAVEARDRAVYKTVVMTPPPARLPK